MLLVAVLKQPFSNVDVIAVQSSCAHGCVEPHTFLTAHLRWMQRMLQKRRTLSHQPVLLADDGFGTVEAPGDWLQPGQGVGSAAVFLTKTSEASAAVLRIWHQAKGACWALPGPRTRHLLNMMVRMCLLAGRYEVRRAGHRAFAAAVTGNQPVDGVDGWPVTLNLSKPSQLSVSFPLSELKVGSQLDLLLCPGPAI